MSETELYSVASLKEATSPEASFAGTVNIICMGKTSRGRLFYVGSRKGSDVDCSSYRNGLRPNYDRHIVKMSAISSLGPRLKI